MPISSTASNSINSWRKYDQETRVDRSDPQNPKVDHKASARANLTNSGENFAMLGLPFIAPFMNDGLLGGRVHGPMDRVGNTLMALSLVPGAFIGGVKDGVDAAIHGVAALFS